MLPVALGSAQKKSYAKAFADRICEYRNRCVACGLPKTFECVLVVGGYNDVHRKNRVSEGVFCAAVNDTLHQCLQLLPAAPCCAEAERCGDTGAAEAATRMSLVVTGGRAGEGFCGDVSQEEREGRGVAEVEVCGDILQEERDETVVAEVQSQPIQVLPVSQAQARLFGRIPMERGQFGSWQDSMRMYGVLCFEPAEFTLWMTRIVFLGRI